MRARVRVDAGGAGRGGCGMSSQPQLLQIALDPGDVVYTPDWVAKDMVDFFKPTGRILEPCAGDGVFLKYLPPKTEWCEIQKGRDFFSWRERVDFCFGNPPFKVFMSWLEHSFTIADNVIYVIPANKAFNSFRTLKAIFEYGGIVHMRVYGGGASLDFPIGFAVAAVHFKRGYTGGMHTSFYGPTP